MTAGIGLVSIFALLALGFFALLLVAGVVAAIRHGRWGIVLLLGFVASVLFLLPFAMFVGYARVQSDFGGTPSFAPLNSLDRPRLSASMPAAEVASDAELLAIASPAPQIDLDQPAATNAKDKGASGLPDWIDAKAKLHDKVIAAGPYLTQAECAEDIQKQTLAWLCEKAGIDCPEQVPANCEKLLDDLMRRTHLTRRLSKEGIIYLQYARVHSSDRVVELIRKKIAAVADSVGSEQPAVAKSEKDNKRPGWVDGDITAAQKVFTSGPFTTPEQGREDARRQLAEWVWREARGDNADAPEAWGVASSEVEGRFDKERYLEKRDTSVGEVYLLYTLGEIDDADQEWLDNRVRFWVQKSQRETGLRTLAVGGGLMLGALGLLHGVLRTGGRHSDEAP